MTYFIKTLLGLGFQEFATILGIIIGLIGILYAAIDVKIATKLFNKENQSANLLVSLFNPKYEINEFFFAFNFKEYKHIIIPFPVIVANIGDVRAKEIEILCLASNGLIPPKGWDVKINCPRFIETISKRTSLNEHKTAYGYKISYLGPKEAGFFEFPFLSHASTQFNFQFSQKDISYIPDGKEVGVKVFYSYVFDIEVICENNKTQKIKKKISINFVDGGQEEAMRTIIRLNKDSPKVSKINKMKMRYQISKISDSAKKSNSIYRNTNLNKYAIVWPLSLKEELPKKHQVFKLESGNMLIGFKINGRYVKPFFQPI